MEPQDTGDKSLGKKTLVFGASMNPGRYAYLATERLHHAGHPIKLISIKKGELYGEKFLDLREEPHVEDVDTITLYVGARNLDQWHDYILSLKPKRIIFNPGTENMALFEAAKAQGIEVEMACTLVMLSAQQY